MYLDVMRLTYDLWLTHIFDVAAHTWSKQQQQLPRKEKKTTRINNSNKINNDNHIWPHMMVVLIDFQFERWNVLTIYIYDCAFQVSI